MKNIAWERYRNRDRERERERKREKEAHKKLILIPLISSKLSV
jgi:hypothetical protein